MQLQDRPGRLLESSARLPASREPGRRSSRLPHWSAEQPQYHCFGRRVERQRWNRSSRRLICAPPISISGVANFAPACWMIARRRRERPSKYRARRGGDRRPPVLCHVPAVRGCHGGVGRGTPAHRRPKHRIYQQTTQEAIRWSSSPAENSARWWEHEAYASECITIWKPRQRASPLAYWNAAGRPPNTAQMRSDLRTRSRRGAELTGSCRIHARWARRVSSGRASSISPGRAPLATVRGRKSDARVSASNLLRRTAAGLPPSRHRTPPVTRKHRRRRDGWLSALEPPDAAGGNRAGGGPRAQQGEANPLDQSLSLDIGRLMTAISLRHCGTATRGETQGFLQAPLHLGGQKARSTKSPGKYRADRNFKHTVDR